MPHFVGHGTRYSTARSLTVSYTTTHPRPRAAFVVCVVGIMYI